MPEKNRKVQTWDYFWLKYTERITFSYIKMSFHVISSIPKFVHTYTSKILMYALLGQLHIIFFFFFYFYDAFVWVHLCVVFNVLKGENYGYYFKANLATGSDYLLRVPVV